MSSADKSAELVGRLDRLPFSKCIAICSRSALSAYVRCVRFRPVRHGAAAVAREFGLNQAQAGLLDGRPDRRFSRRLFWAPFLTTSAAYVVRPLSEFFGLHRTVATAGNVFSLSSIVLSLISASAARSRRLTLTPNIAERIRRMTVQ